MGGRVQLSRRREQIFIHCYGVFVGGNTLLLSVKVARKTNDESQWNDKSSHVFEFMFNEPIALESPLYHEVICLKSIYNSNGSVME